VTLRALRMLAAACLATGLCGYAAGRWLPLHAGDGTVPRTSTAAKVTAAPERATPSPAATAQSADAESFAARYTHLTRSADDGDAAAARELARTLTECAALPALQRAAFSLQMMLDPASAMGARLSRKPSSHARLEQSAAKTQELARARADKCAGVDAAQLQSRARWLYLAALGGDARSALAFGRGDFLTDAPLDQLEQVPFWREHAPDMLRRALAGGEAEAAAWLAQAYDPARPPGALQVVPLPADAVQAYAYYAVLGLGGDGETIGMAQAALERLTPQLSVAQRAEAERLVSDICALDLPGRCGAGTAPSH